VESLANISYCTLNMGVPPHFVKENEELFEDDS